jgi:UMF1 family MFS transporter
VGTVQGGSQALSRSLFGIMVPKERSSEFFGFFSTSAKFAGIFGPLLFGLIGQWMGESRLSILFLMVFFIVGGGLLSRVDVPRAIAESRTAYPQ